jgi:hypothetical protein
VELRGTCQMEGITMTEERILRMTRDDFDADGFNDMANRYWDDLEPAPPKDFKPKCHEIYSTNFLDGTQEYLCKSC